MMMRMSLPKVSRLNFQLRMALSLGFLSLLVAAIAALALWGLFNLRDSARQAAGDNQTSHLASEVALQALLCRRYEKDFFLNSGDPIMQDASLQQWHQASIDLRGAIKAFADAATTDADKQQAAAWRNAWSDYGQGFGRVEIGINGGEIKTPQDALRTLEPFQANIQTLNDQAVQLAEAKTKSAQQTSLKLDQVGTSTIWQVLLIAALVFVGSVAWSLLFPLWLVRPIKALRAAAARLASGDLTARVGLQRNDEFGVLAQSFDHMAITLEQSTADLEAQYASANAARAAAEEAHHQIAEQLSMIDAQRAVIVEMSVPILPLTDSTLVLPLIGALDSSRLHQAQERVLAAIQTTSARYLLLDVTGIPIIDTQVAKGLIQVVQSSQLLGCKVVLVGIRPEVAQAVVGLGLDLSSVATQSTLQSGIAFTQRSQEKLHTGLAAALG